MTANEPCHAIAVLQQLHAVDDVHRGSIRGTFRAEDRKKGPRHYAAWIGVALVAEQADQRSVACFINVA